MDKSGLARTYGVELFFSTPTPTLPDKAKLLGKLREHCGRIDPLDNTDESDLLAFLYLDYLVSYEDKQMPAQCLVAPSAPAKPRRATGFLDRMREAGACYEKGYSHFRAGRYWNALQQYEQGTLVSGEFPWNYFGRAMTLMHMIEIGAMPESKIGLALALAVKDVQNCLLICPNERDYKDALRVIREYRKKHENAKHRS